MHLSRRQPLHKNELNLTQEQGCKSKIYSSANAGGKSQLVCDEHILNIVCRMYSIVSVV